MSYGVNPPSFREEDWAKQLWFNSVFGFVKSKTEQVTTTASYTPKSEEFCIWADATSGGITITIPLALNYKGRTIAVVKSDSSANAVTISRSGSDTLANLTSFTLGTQYHSALLHSNGNATWAILARFPNVVA
jgi:hypothetical protein